jgi:hydrogenase-1 operon protein HyaF
MADRAASCLDGHTTGMAWSVLAEVGRLLEELASKGQTASIDLRSLPLTDADREELDALLGRGEVRVELELAGRSEVWETGYPGAWWIRHRGAGDRISSEEIAVCPVPEILMTHPADIETAVRRLRRDLQNNRPSATAESSENQLETSHV